MPDTAKKKKKTTSFLKMNCNLNAKETEVNVKMFLLHERQPKALQLGPKEIDGLVVPPCNVLTLLTDHLITG